MLAPRVRIPTTVPEAGVGHDQVRAARKHEQRSPAASPHGRDDRLSLASGHDRPRGSAQAQRREFRERGHNGAAYSAIHRRMALTPGSKKNLLRKEDDAGE